MSVKDAARFEQDITSILPDLYGTALRFARNPADAEDLVAETVCKAWAALHTLHDVTRFRAWVIRILTNTYYADLRARSVRPRAEPLPDECADEFSIFDRLHQPFLLWWGNPEREFLDRILREDMERAIAALPEPFRPVVVLADLQGLTYIEIAETLDVPVGTVRSRLARGRAILQEVLWNHGCDAGLVSNDEPTRTRMTHE